MQKRSALHEPERSGARRSQCVMDSGKQSLPDYVIPVRTGRGGQAGGKPRFRNYQ